LERILKKLTKIVLNTLPKAPFSPDGACPKCGFLLEAKIFRNSIVLLCKNRNCDYFEFIEIGKEDRR
jgi:hypothetical protein